MKRVLLSALLLASIVAVAQKPGELTPKLALKADPQQTYALYVPAHYDLSRRLPVVYVFDPGARGALAAARFKAAADKYGFLVAASNVSHNGPAEPQIKALESMSIDVESRFPIDTARRYVAGFSGGARAAALAAIICPKCFAGVLAFGAGLPSAPKLTEAPFLYLAAVGTGDFNYPEVVDLAPELDKLNATYRIFVFDGDHDWPSEAAITEAFAWMQFHAIKRGQVVKPSGFPDSDWNARMTAAQSFVKGNPLQAVREFDSIARDFQGLRDTSDASKQAAQLKSSSDFKKAQKDEKKIAEKTAELSGHFEDMVRTILVAQGAADKQAPTTEAVRSINQMVADAGSKDRFQSIAARRALSSSYVSLAEFAAQLKPTQTEQMVDLANLATLLHPQSADAYYWLGLAQTNAGRKKNAIAAFKKSVALGTPKSRLLEDTRLKTIAGEPDFKALIAN